MYLENIIIIPLLKMRKPCIKRSLAQGHIVNKYWDYRCILADQSHFVSVKTSAAD